MPSIVFLLYCYRRSLTIAPLMRCADCRWRSARSWNRCAYWRRSWTRRCSRWRACRRPSWPSRTTSPSRSRASTLTGVSASVSARPSPSTRPAEEPTSACRSPAAADCLRTRLPIFYTALIACWVGPTWKLQVLAVRSCLLTRRAT